MTTSFAASVPGSGCSNAGEQTVSKGDRVSVYWPDDDKWYDGRVHSQVAASWWVYYDDGDKQLHDLSVERYKVLSVHSELAAHCAVLEAAAATPPSQLLAKRHSGAEGFSQCHAHPARREAAHASTPLHTSGH